MNQETELLEASNDSLATITRAETDIQISTAKRYPRSLTNFKRDVLNAVCLDSETAESCVYYRPVGKKKNEETGKYEEAYAEGPSIRMAEIVAASYGNIRAGSRTIERTERFVKCQGVCHDLEKNVYASLEVTESTVDREGKPFSERMRVVVEKATLAKAYRDAVFKVVPRAFLKSAIEEAKRVAGGEGASLEQRRDKVKQWLQQIKMPEARVFAALGVKGWADIGVEQLSIITGLRTAIKENEITAAEAFPEMVDAKPANTDAILPSKKVEPTPAESAGAAELKAEKAKAPAAKAEGKQ